MLSNGGNPISRSRTTSSWSSADSTASCGISDQAMPRATRSSTCQPRAWLGPAAANWLIHYLEDLLDRVRAVRQHGLDADAADEAVKLDPRFAPQLRARRVEPAQRRPWGYGRRAQAEKLQNAGGLNPHPHLHAEHAGDAASRPRASQLL
jgi:hypothetical protein